jgi:hypothetical protein
MRLPIFATALVALCLASVTAVHVSAVRPGAPRDRERVVRMTRGGGQRLDSIEAVLHSHEDRPAFHLDSSSEPVDSSSAAGDLEPGHVGGVPAGAAQALKPAWRLVVFPAQAAAPPGSTVIPRLSGRAPPSR